MSGKDGGQKGERITQLKNKYWLKAGSGGGGGGGRNDSVSTVKRMKAVKEGGGS